jgi:SAM-dependent methyltransferase
VSKEQEQLSPNRNSSLMSAHPYDKYYYDHYHTDTGSVPYVREQGPWLPLFRAMAEYIDISLKPKKVLDAGCAKGFLVEALRDRGIEAFGIDLSEYAISEVRPDIRSYCRATSVVEPLCDWYDLIVCIEVLEHMTEEEGRRAIVNICKSTSDVLFSSSPDDLTEPTHVNVRPRSYWVERFFEEGFAIDSSFDARAIAPHALRFRKSETNVATVDVLLDLRDSTRQDLETLTQRNNELINANAVLSAHLQSMGWRSLERIRRVRNRMAPPGTLRSEGYEALRQGVKSVIDDGIRGALKKFLAATFCAMKNRNKNNLLKYESVTQLPIIFNEHALAHSLLDGLKGLEIGPAAHNPFGLKTRNVELAESRDFYASIQENVMGVTPPKVDIWASADSIPIPDQSEGFILSSHVVEHLPNVIAALIEWDRIIKNGGYVFMIVPLPWALPADKDRELTSCEHFLNDYRQRVTIETHPVEGVPGGKMGHYHTFTADSLLQVVKWMGQYQLCDWELIAREDVDTKVGNGFTLAFKVRHERAGNPALRT